MSCPRKTVVTAGQCWLSATKISSDSALLGTVGSQRVPRVELVMLTGSMQIQIFMCGDRAQHRKDGACIQAVLEETQHRDNCGCSSSPCYEATQISLSLYVSGVSKASVSPPEPRVSVCK